MAYTLHRIGRLPWIIVSVLLAASLTLGGCTGAATASGPYSSAPEQVSLWRVQYEHYGASDTRAILDWNYVRGATSFQYRCDGEGWLPAGSAPRTEHTVKGTFEPGKRYCFTVRAINQHGSTVSEPLCAMTPTSPAPTNLVLSRNGVQLTATWDAAEGAAEYQGEVEFYDDGDWHGWGFGYGNSFVVTGTSFSWDNYPTLNARAYSFRVHVRANGGRPGWYSPWAYSRLPS